MPLRFDSLSRYKNTDVVQDNNGVVALGYWSRPEFMFPENVDQKDIITIKVDNSIVGRPDKISMEYYGVPDLDWVIVMFNKPLNPLGWPLSGMVIKIPSKSVVFGNL